MSKISIWLLAIRPKTLPAAIGPVLLGTAFAYSASTIEFSIAVTCLLGAMLLQVAANLANDYFDYKKGIDTSERLGPIRVTAQGLLTEREILGALIINIILAVLDGLFLIYKAGFVILIIGTISIIALLTYSGTVIAFGYRGLGDIFVFVFFGIIAVNGTFFAITGKTSPQVLLGSVTSGLLVNNILVINNYRDLENDKKTGKKTLAVLIGFRATLFQYILSLILSYVVVFALFLFGNSSYFIFLPMITLPIAWKLTYGLIKMDIGPDLNQVLAKTARLSLQFQLLLSMGIFLS